MSTSLPKSTEPAKPDRPDGLPLFAHASGRWAKKIRGKLHYFGKWEDRDAALNKWLDEKDELLAGRTPRAKADGLQVRDLVNRFLTEKESLVETRELRRCTFNEYHRACGQFIGFIGKSRLVSDIRPEDFAGFRNCLAHDLGLSELGKRIGMVRSLFNGEERRTSGASVRRSQCGQTPVRGDRTT